jgi:hypothetical protein
MPNHPRSNHDPSNDDLSNDDFPYGQQPQRDGEDIELESLEDLDDSLIDDPGDAQRSSKSEPDGDGEEEMR